MVLFSIITVVYNAHDALACTVSSIQCQTYTNYEHIIVDGGSEDGTPFYVRSINSDKIIYIYGDDDGIYDAMNKGIVSSSGKYLLFLNAGDTFSRSTILEVVKNIIDRDCPSIIYGGANVLSATGLYITRLMPLTLNKKNLDRFSTRVVCHQAIFVRKSCAVQYDDKYRLKGELNWYYDLAETVPAAFIMKCDDVFCNYYFGGIGDKEFFSNYLERLRVLWSRNNIFNILRVSPYLLIPILFRVKRLILGK